MKEVYNFKRAFIITDSTLYQLGACDAIINQLRDLGIETAEFFDIRVDPQIQDAMKGLPKMHEFEPDVIIAVGGGSAIDTAKMNMEILSEQREIEKNYRAIGEWFVSEFQGEVPDAVKDVVAAVNASKEKIAHLEASKKKDPSHEAEPVEKSDDAKTCSVCGTVSDSNFCPHCGAPMGK